MVVDELGFNAFSAELHAAMVDRKDNRQTSLDLLSTEKSVIVYSYGARGRDAAQQLRKAGINCLLFDNSQQALDRAVAGGFETTANLQPDLPVIIAAGQNQLSILASLSRPAYSLAEALYAFDLLNQYGKARLFSEIPAPLHEDLYEVYRRLDPICRQGFLNVLLYRLSLDVGRIASTRKLMAHMWVPPATVQAIASFCDVGAYDGDTLISMKAAFPSLSSSFAIEPNPALAAAIASAAKRTNLTNRIFTGAAWSHKTRLSCHIYASGMMAIAEDAQGTIEAEALDNLTRGERYDYVKLDVEGSEGKALEGGHTLIRNAHCVAVASYHLPTDFIDIPRTIATIAGETYEREWRCAFGHYSECFDDSIFYFYRIAG